MARNSKYSPEMVEAYFGTFGIPAPVFELQFAPPRKFRFDLAWPDKKVALEIEGGVWIGGRHTRGSGFLRDMEKYNLAALSGWTVLRCVPRNLFTRQVAMMVLTKLSGK